MPALGPVQLANRLTFFAEALRAAEESHGGTAGQAALVAFDDAAVAWERIGQPYPLAVALLRATEAALAAGDRGAAAARLRRAEELADRLGAGPLLDEIESSPAARGSYRAATLRARIRRRRRRWA